MVNRQELFSWRLFLSDTHRKMLTVRFMRQLLVTAPFRKRTSRKSYFVSVYPTGKWQWITKWTIHRKIT